jgi:hypothetical protein
MRSTKSWLFVAVFMAGQATATMGAGFFSEVYTDVGQWGTHVDPPAHFIRGLRSAGSIVTNHYQDRTAGESRSGGLKPTFPKPKGGSGFPARVFAIAPELSAGIYIDTGSLAVEDGS